MISLDPTETIAAIASPPGPSARGIIRLAGPESIKIALSGLACKAALKHSSGAARIDGHLRVSSLQTAFDASLYLWPNSRSYTGGPAAEIHVVGSPPILEAILSDCLARGARGAEPGEFTLRAFLSGRMDLTQAEAVLDVIDARTVDQVRSALDRHAGGLSGPIGEIRDRLLGIVAHLEAGLDFSEEPDVDPLGRAQLAAELSTNASALLSIAERLVSRDRPEGKPRVVLFGPPNVGKSRLFNALIGREQAMVAPIAGTTRDYLIAECDCDGLIVDLIDTAGVEAPEDEIQFQAQTYRDIQTLEASLIISCHSAEAIPPDRIGNFGKKPCLAVLTKSDLTSPDSDSHLTPTSAATGEGISLLRSRIRECLRSQDHSLDKSAGNSARCSDGLTRAGKALRAAAEGLTLGLGDELISIDVRHAVDELAVIVGEIVTDDVLDWIFRRFCIGK